MYTKERSSKAITLSNEQMKRIQSLCAKTSFYSSGQNLKPSSSSSGPYVSKTPTTTTSSTTITNIKQKQIEEQNNNKNEIENEVEIIETHSMDLPDILRNRLFEHQKYGVDWLYRAYKQSTGGILGDDMGLGKTFQVCCLLCGLLRDKKIHKILVVCPVSVIASWFREINEHIIPHVNNLSIDLITSDVTKNKRVKMLK